MSNHSGDTGGLSVVESERSVGDLWYVLEPDGRLRGWSDRLPAVTGYEDETLDGLPAAELFESADCPDVAAAIEAVADGAEVVGEGRLRTATDGRVPYECSAAPITNDGEVCGIVGVGRDLSEGRGQDSYQSLKREYETVLETARDALFLLDVTDDAIRFRRFNDPRGLYTDGSSDDVRGKTPTEVFGEDLGTELEAKCRAALERGSTVSYERRFERCAEPLVWRTRLTPVDDGGQAERIVGTAHDITELKERERLLRRFQEAVEQTAHSVYITDRNGVIEYVNPAFERTTGYTEAEVVGETPAILKSDAHDAEFFDRMWSTILAGNVWESEVVNRRKDGTTYTVDQTISPIVQDGEITGFVAVNNDISELKAYERRLETQRDNLRVLNQIVRHDIRNDLQLVLAYAETLSEHVEDEHAEFVDQLLAAARSAVETTRAARAVAEVMIRTDADPEPVAVRPALQNQVEDVRSMYESAVVEVDGPLPNGSVLADDMLESVFRNLLTNAIEHNDEDVPEVTVSASRDDGHLEVRVADNGPGIPDDRKEAIFEEGEKGLESSGSGLGLYLVETLVDRYGGDVRVEDNEPKGSVFAVRLRTAS